MFVNSFESRVFYFVWVSLERRRRTRHFSLSLPGGRNNHNGRMCKEIFFFIFWWKDGQTSSEQISQIGVTNLYLMFVNIQWSLLKWKKYVAIVGTSQILKCLQHSQLSTQFLKSFINLDIIKKLLQSGKWFVQFRALN